MRSVMRGIEKPNAAKGKEESRRGTTVDSDTEERLRETERDTERERERERERGDASIEEVGFRGRSRLLRVAARDREEPRHVAWSLLCTRDLQLLTR
jgi:hypothetical protein